MSASEHFREPDRDEARFIAFYKENRKKLYDYVRLKAPQLDPHDIADETFTRAWERWGQLGRFEAPDPTPWLFKVAMNLIKTRAHKVQREMPTELADYQTPWLTAPWSTAELREELQGTLKAIAKLPPTQRDAIAMEAADLSKEQISAAMDCSVKTVREYLAKGRAQIRQLTGNAERRQRRRRGSLPERSGGK